MRFQTRWHRFTQATGWPFGLYFTMLLCFGTFLGLSAMGIWAASEAVNAVQAAQ